MSLVDRISQDLNEALKAGEAARVSTLRLLKNSLTAEAKAQQADLDDAAATKIIQKEVKQRRDSITSFKEGGRDDLVAKEQAELDLLEQYLPKPIDEDKLKGIIDEAIKQTEASSKADMGKVMAAVMAKAGGAVDGAKLAELVRQRLAN